MGWTSYHATFYKNGNIDRKAECDNINNCSMADNKGKFEVLKSSMVGSTYYGAIKRTIFATETEEENIKVFAVVFLTSTDIKDYFNFSYKDMDETCCPYKYDCPKGILDLLSPTDNKWAMEWRNKCRENLAKKNNPYSLNKLALGSVIEFTTPCDLQSGTKAGTKITLYKNKNYNGQTIWSDGYYRYSTKLIGDNYTVIKVG